MVTIMPATKNETPKGKTLYLVFRDGKLVGTIWKPHNTRSDVYPWSVREMGGDTLAHFYNDADSTKIPNFDYDKCKIGGKVAAFLFAATHFATVNATED